MPNPGATAVLGALLASGVAHAQALPGVSRLDWETVTIFAVPDKVEGVRLHVISAAVPGQPARDFVGRFEPAAVGQWVDSAESILAHRPPPLAKASLPTQIQTPILIDLTGGGAILGRVHDGSEWRPGVFLYLAENYDGPPLVIQTDLSRARSLIAALRKAAERSRVDSGVVMRGELTPSRALPGDTTALPVLRSFKRPAYPPHLLQRRIEGEVLIRFVVDSTGTVRRRSIEVVWASDPAFAKAARQGFEAARFRPARLRGIPANRGVYYRMVFRLAGAGITVT